MVYDPSNKTKIYIFYKAIQTTLELLRLIITNDFRVTNNILFKKINKYIYKILRCSYGLDYQKILEIEHLLSKNPKSEMLQSPKL
jgi:hypothetical protein